MWKKNTGALNKLFFTNLMFCVFLLLNSLQVFSQEVEASVDTTSIRIGEQVRYNIAVETDSTDLVVFPEGQTFSPLEMVESYPADTNRVQDRFRLIREYALTQWDSGSYTIPRQRVTINNNVFFTDSILIKVGTVAVDTTKQKMFPIKPSIEVSSGVYFPKWAWWVIGLLLLAGLGIYLFFRRKKKKAEAAKSLPPYEQAIFELKQLDSSDLLENREVKEYYSRLSAAVRNYLDGEVYDHAMESTTSELIYYLERERELGRLNLTDETIRRLKTILERADLAKFANSRPDVITAREDRSSVENVINDTKASIPQPSEEDLLRDQQYREKLERKKKIRKLVIGISVVIILISGATAYIISTQGFDYFKDTYLGNKSKDLLEGEWIRSEYGSPPVTITTPMVLKRALADSSAISSGKEIFRAGDIGHNVYIDLNTRSVGQGFELQSAVEEVYGYLERRGARNIITKQEKISTLNGAEGLRIFGTMGIQTEKSDKVLQKQYAILNFAEGGGYQQIVLIYNEGDKYAEEIAQRITNSVELRNTEE